jgi:hypothetical protein
MKNRMLVLAALAGPCALLLISGWPLEYSRILAHQRLSGAWFWGLFVGIESALLLIAARVRSVQWPLSVLYLAACGLASGLGASFAALVITALNEFGASRLARAVEQNPLEYPVIGAMMAFASLGWVAGGLSGLLLALFAGRTKYSAGGQGRS